MNTSIKIVADAVGVADCAALCSPSTPVAFGGTRLRGATTTITPDLVITDKHSSLGTAPPMST